MNQELPAETRDYTINGEPQGSARQGNRSSTQIAIYCNIFCTVLFATRTTTYLLLITYEITAPLIDGS